MRKGRIENWQELKALGGIRIFGNVYECDTFEEGEEMFTSILVRYHSVLGSLMAETQSGSMYHLGKAKDKPETLKEILARQMDSKNNPGGHLN